MASLLAVIVVLVGTFAASLAVEKVLGRSRKAMIQPGWFLVFFAVFIPLFLVVFNSVPVSSSLIYAAHGLCGGAAALAAQCFYGAKLARNP